MSKPAQTTIKPGSTPEMITVDDTAEQVLCDGGNGPLGHPAVYYAFDDRTSVECLYCDRVFVKKSAVHTFRKI